MRVNRDQIESIHRILMRCCAICLVTLSVMGTGDLLLADAETIYTNSSLEDVRTQTLNWMISHSEHEEWKPAFEQLWSTASPEHLTETVLESGLLVNPEIEEWRKIPVGSIYNHMESYEALLEKLTAASTSEKPDEHFMLSQVSLYVASTLTRSMEYDEAWELFAILKPEQLIDPGSYFFYKSICAQQLLKREAALESLTELLDQTEKIPTRYSRVGELMKIELESLEEESIGEIAHKMGDSERRLELGRAGRRVQKVQKDILDSLDKMIEDLEKQQQQQQQAGAGQGQGGQQNQGSIQPLQDSIIKGSTAPGEVDPKKFKKQGSWGDLPPKAEARARSLIDRNYPAHYQQAIERYFRKLATRPAGE
ncbi:hypothetical protein Pla110_14140 [Polystyrenella longa]|uniref:Uncharacterized protein n=1 Tax=Polystyrenella longa TaxID=2528007 RepID=A0A518CKE7_9PLAN|nr:hypothetical protein [Polystyrenella longa]QDU79700.1 hypothetical protein Pla110_14140 [Polystyrenella longa]